MLLINVRLKKIAFILLLIVFHKMVDAQKKQLVYEDYFTVKKIEGISDLNIYGFRLIIIDQWLLAFFAPEFELPRLLYLHGNPVLVL